MPPLHRSKILHEKSKHLTNWLEFTEIDYQDEAGQRRSWEVVHRRSRNEAAIIVAQLRPSGKYILVRQFRLPNRGIRSRVSSRVSRFWRDSCRGRLRELSEETGYQVWLEKLQNLCIHLLVCLERLVVSFSWMLMKTLPSNKISPATHRAR